MQLMLILGIVFAIGAVVFALQNNVAIIVTFAVWQFEGSQALVLLLTLGAGALIAGLVSSPRKAHPVPRLLASPHASLKPPARREPASLSFIQGT